MPQPSLLVPTLYQRLFPVSLFLAAFLFISLSNSHAVRLLRTSPEQLIDASDAIVVGTVHSAHAGKDAQGLIYTEFVIHVQSAYKGDSSATMLVRHPGGKVGNRIEITDDFPHLLKGEVYVLSLRQNNDRSWAFIDTLWGIRPMSKSSTYTSSLLKTLNALYPLRMMDVPLFVQDKSTTTGLITDINNIPSRFIAPDRGEAIPCIIDASVLPPGMTTEQALTAVSNVFAAWEQACSVRFTIEEMTTFPQGVDTIAVDDRKLRIQLGDPFNRINGIRCLGRGGRVAFQLSDFPNGGNGGNVNGLEFFETVSGFAILSHTDVLMADLKVFEETLCHEIGHAISMAHSSYNDPEPDQELFQSIMYIEAHGDPRGAQLNAYDTNTVRKLHPWNTPPFGYHRMMTIVTGSPDQPDVPRINEIQIRGYDLQSEAVTVLLTNATAINGSFTFDGTTLKYQPNPGVFAQGSIDPADAPGSAFERVSFRVTDGTNLSPIIYSSVVGFTTDTEPNRISDGLPDPWMTTFFGHIEPLELDGSRPQDDPDEDHLTNLDEYLLGSDPTDPNSGLQIDQLTTNALAWQTTNYEVYEVHEASSLGGSFERMSNPVSATSTTSQALLSTNASDIGFFRIEKVP